LTEESSHWRQFVYYWHIRLSSLKTSSSSEETTNAPQLTAFMVFTTNAKEDTT